MKRQKDRTLKDEFPRLLGAQYATGNNSRKNEEMEPKQQKHTIVDVTDDGSKAQGCQEQYSIGLYFHHQSHPQLDVVCALAPSLHSFWSYFSTDLE